MLYYLADNLTPQIGVLNVFTYITVRAGGALFTGFFICVVAGPRMIAFLRALKIGQYIKQDHVKDLHALHQGKAGTPTMGGLLFIVSTIAALALWAIPTNRLMLICVAVLCLMDAVGFVNDYTKLRRKKNDGITARMKLGGQIVVGLLLGIAVTLFPVTLGATTFNASDIRDWEAVAAHLTDGSEVKLSTETREEVAAVAVDGIRPSERAIVLMALNDLVGSSVEPASRNVLRENRCRLEEALGESVAPSPTALQSSVAIPGFKDLLIPLGAAGYILFVIFVIVSTSNAVNLTDGLDGLAAGAAVISLFALTGIAYIVSRADWSGYLYITHVPEASELAVFGAALLGSGLGFLWYNAYPAEVFMGDTGSLALGGVIATMAILTKQELLIPIVGGLFVIEALSVVIQVASYKTRGKRVFRMAPLHHHFELMGWSESKVTIRFWILALVFALMSLATLKLR